MGARPQEVHRQVGGILFQLCTTAPTAAQVFSRVQLASRRSQLNTAGSLFGTKSLLNAK